ncbi:MAG: recombinase family protein [Oscillospiraceae bacterium]|nr:recombinase family protein [Oscillospiraceae bacterium]
MGRKRQDDTQPKRQTSTEILWRIAVYIRLSREDGGEESQSVTNQRKILDEYLRENFAGEYEVVDYYVDDGLTGTDDTRESFMRMIADVEAGRVNCVLVKTLSRAFRNHADQGYYIEEYFVQKNVRFISTGDPRVDTFINPDVIYGLEVPISGLMNDRYAAKISADIRRTFNTKRRNGEFIGSFPPWGYLKDPADKSKFILDENIVPIKREMFRWVVHDGMSLQGVAKQLNELGVPSPMAYKHSIGMRLNTPMTGKSDGMWSGGGVKEQLLNPVNLGHMVQGRHRVVSYKVHTMIKVPQDEWFVVENTHEPTFTQAEYDALVAALKRDTRRPNGVPTVHLFSGFMRCFDCGKAMQRRASKGHTYYACRTYGEKSNTACTKHSIRVDRLEEAVLAALRLQISLIDNLAQAVEQINTIPKQDTKSARIEKALRDKFRETERVKTLNDGLYIDWKTGNLSHEEYRRMKAKFAEQLVQLITVIDKLTEEQRQLGNGVTSENAALVAFSKHRNLHALDRAVLLELVDKIHVHEDKQLTVTFRFADELARIIEYVQINAPGELLTA